MLIGISGKIGSGKDTIGSIIQWITTPQEHRHWNNNIELFIDVNRINNENWNFVVKKFGYKLKVICSILSGIPVEDFEKQEVKDKVLSEIWSYFRWQELTSKVNPMFTTFEEAIDYHGDQAPIKEYHPTVRWLLQNVGTEAMKNNVHPNIWINALFADYKPKALIKRSNNSKDWQNPNWIITDTRFPNEANAIKVREGILIRTKRNPINGIPNGKGILGNIKAHEHPSETALDNYEGFNYEIDNNGTIEELIAQVIPILTKEGII